MTIKQNDEPPFEDDELLYRRLRPDWVTDGMVDPYAVTLPRCSVDRQRLCPDPYVSLAKGNESETGLAAISVGDVPNAIGPVSAVEQTVLETIVRHEPENGNPAHSEIRVKRRGRDEPFYKNLASGRLKDFARDQIASRMSIVIPPEDTEF